MAYKPTVFVEGVPVTVANIGRVRRVVRETNKRFTLRKAANLFWATQGVVPYLSGRLYGSAYIREVGANPAYPRQEVGYDTAQAPHALVVHETPGMVHPTRGPRHEPKQDHFLSEPRDRMAGTFVSELRQELVEAIRRMRSLSGSQKGGVVTSIRRQL